MNERDDGATAFNFANRSTESDQAQQSVADFSPFTIILLSHLPVG